MKMAQALRVGNVVLLKDEAFVLQRAEYYRSDRNVSVVKMKLSHLLTNAVVEIVRPADERLPVVILDRKPCIYSYFAEPSYVFMDESFNQYELGAERLENVLPFLEDQMPCVLVFCQDQPFAVELPLTIIREIAYTEPAVRGDTAGKLMKPARLASGFTLQVAGFCEAGDKIEIDTRTNTFIRKSLASR